MKQPNALVKVGVVLIAVLLVGGFVSYRAGAFNRFMPSGTPSADSGGSPTHEENKPDPT
jgi:hypothetical protein